MQEIVLPFRHRSERNLPEGSRMPSDSTVIARPGRPVAGTAAEAAGVDPNSELAERWRERLGAIERAERAADQESDSIRIR